MKKTSIEANNTMNNTGRKATHKERIMHGMNSNAILKYCGGTYEAIAIAANLTEAQTWKRLSDLVKENKIYDTGRVAPLASKEKGTVWCVWNANL